MCHVLAFGVSDSYLNDFLPWGCWAGDRGRCICFLRGKEATSDACSTCRNPPKSGTRYQHPKEDVPLLLQHNAIDSPPSEVFYYGQCILKIVSIVRSLSIQDPSEGYSRSTGCIFKGRGGGRCRNVPFNRTKLISAVFTCRESCNHTALDSQTTRC